MPVPIRVKDFEPKGEKHPYRWWCGDSYATTPDGSIATLSVGAVWDYAHLLQRRKKMLERFGVEVREVSTPGWLGLEAIIELPQVEYLGHLYEPLYYNDRLSLDFDDDDVKVEYVAVDWQVQPRYILIPLQQLICKGGAS